MITPSSQAFCHLCLPFSCTGLTHLAMRREALQKHSAGGDIRLGRKGGSRRWSSCKTVPAVAEAKMRLTHPSKGVQEDMGS